MQVRSNPMERGGPEADELRQRGVEVLRPQTRLLPVLRTCRRGKQGRAQEGLLHNRPQLINHSSHAIHTRSQGICGRFAATKEGTKLHRDHLQVLIRHIAAGTSKGSRDQQRRQMRWS